MRTASLRGLAGLALNVFTGIADTLALVRLGLTDLADVGRHLSHFLLVNASDPDSGRGGHLEGDAVRRVDHDRMAESERQLNLGRPSGDGPVADTDDLQLLA